MKITIKEKSGLFFGEKWHNKLHHIKTSLYKVQELVKEVLLICFPEVSLDGWCTNYFGNTFKLYFKQLIFPKWIFKNVMNICIIPICISYLKFVKLSKIQ